MGWLAFPFALLAGALIAVQAGSNAQLKQNFGEPMPALVMNYVIGLSVVLGYTVVARLPWPAIGKMAGVPWWAWIGGIAGAVYGVAAILLAKGLGAATLMALVVTGQLISSVVLDHFGWVGFPTHPAGLWRVVGCILMIGGFVLIAKF